MTTLLDTSDLNELPFRHDDYLLVLDGVLTSLVKESNLDVAQPMGVILNKSTDTSFPHATWTVPVYDTVEYDSHGFFDSVNGRITVPVGTAGTYIIGYSVQVTPMDHTLRGAIYVNGVTRIGYAGEAYTQGNITRNLTHAMSAQLAEGDYVDIWYYQNGGNTETIYGVGMDRSPILYAARLN